MVVITSPISRRIFLPYSCRQRARSNSKSHQLALARGIFDHDPVNPLGAGLLGHERQAEPLAHHAGKEAANRVLLPAGRFHDGRDGRALLALEHFDHVGLLRIPCSRLWRSPQGLVFALLAAGSFDPPRTPFGCVVAPILDLVRLLGLLRGNARLKQPGSAHLAEQLKCNPDDQGNSEEDLSQVAIGTGPNIDRPCGLP
jgi:hypothetical protein